MCISIMIAVEENVLCIQILEQENPIAATAYIISEYRANYIQHSAIG